MDLQYIQITDEVLNPQNLKKEMNLIIIRAILVFKNSRVIHKDYKDLMKYKPNFGPVHSDTEHVPLPFIPLITYWVKRFSNNFVYLQLSFSFENKLHIFGFLEKN